VLMLLQAAIFAVPAPTIPLFIGVPALMGAALDPAVARDADERFYMHYGFPRSELLDAQAGAGPFCSLEAGDTVVELALKVKWPGRWLQGQKDRATATLLRRMISEGFEVQGVPLRVQIVALCKAIARVRKALMPQGVNMPRTSDEDRARLHVAIAVLEEDMLQASPPFKALYSQRIESKLAKMGPDKEFARLVAKVFVIENFGECDAVVSQRAPATEEAAAVRSVPASTEDTSYTGTTEPVMESKSKSKSKKIFKRGASMYDVSKPVRRLSSERMGVIDVK